MKPLSKNSEHSAVFEPAVSYQTSTPKYSQLTAILGGKANIKFNLHNEMDLILLSRSGLPKKTLDSLSKRLGVTMERLSALLHISHRTLQRKSSTESLSVHVSEQILAIAEVIRRGIEVLGSSDNLEQWLHSELPSLDNKKPIDLMDTSFGTHLLLKTLGRIEHGVY